MRVLDKALLKTGFIDENEYAARELAYELSHGDMESDGYSTFMQVLAGLGAGGIAFLGGPAIVETLTGDETGAAYAAEKVHTYPNKQIRVLIGPFTDSGDRVTKFHSGRVTHSGGNNGLEVQETIKRELDRRQRMGRLSKDGVYVLVHDTGRPDREEADLALYGGVGNDYLYAELVDLRTGKIIYTDKIEMSNGRSPSSGGTGIATGLENYLYNNVNELL